MYKKGKPPQGTADALEGIVIVHACCVLMASFCVYEGPEESSGSGLSTASFSLIDYGSLYISLRLMITVCRAFGA